jgi:hypothetical protein
MVERWQVTDWRSRRQLLDPDVFLNGSNPPPTDLVDPEIWNYLIHLADHVSITTSNHHGMQLKRLFLLERGWVEAIRDSRSFLGTAMVDVMDDFTASMFLLTHGFYRQSISALRSQRGTALYGSKENTISILASIRDSSHVAIYQCRRTGEAIDRTAIRGSHEAARARRDSYEGLPGSRTRSFANSRVPANPRFTPKGRAFTHPSVKERPSIIPSRGSDVVTTPPRGLRIAQTVGAGLQTEIRGRRVLSS